MSTSRITKRVGVFGGTFDPIHVGHLAVASAVQKELGLDQVLFVVTSDQWLRETPPVASAGDRLCMVEIAVSDKPGFSASDIDIKREGSTYTFDTLNDLRDELGESSEMFLIVGADSAMSMDRWKNGDRIPELASIVAVGRPGQDFQIDVLGESHPASSAEYLGGPMIDISATHVRGLLSDKRSVSDVVPGSVVDFIEKQGLYI
ncbi:MAG: nicotinate-nucleotide adenylyltransferase [Chloroflexi bacterium]|jgi:nicotinate-nucleotide adenylyltransferase|nr:nicotinate-nucleotide adenylyltransferase [Chloroflexota bacterium]MBT3862334.1 nicotinate-nucleotide adenylyltransferase [Chloroflexota bacterium]MBT4142838.1 nicotinate-nucleotide adenylyltransferase [Chloroflexota bacterium]MBT4341923.1 nicotinate-nucleotide adenylyltransferase [Chloroflexota bacterium]MBT4943093.1 nicotinate-nucleotide adenylyltransferase [Chloroflexota bacterium]